MANMADAVNQFVSHKESRLSDLMSGIRTNLEQRAQGLHHLIDHQRLSHQEIVHENKAFLDSFAVLGDSVKDQLNSSTRVSLFRLMTIGLYHEYGLSCQLV